MKVVCGWCKKDMGEKEPLEDPDATHGICDDCLIKHFPHVGRKILKKRIR